MGFPLAEYVFNSLSCRGLTLTSPAAFTNTTRTLSIPGTTPTCRASCVPGNFEPWSISWVGAQVATTITAATVVVVVNNRTNVTRTTTKFNTELGGFDLPETNSAGTKVTTLILSDYLAKTNITTVIAYPTIYNDYPYRFNWSGVVPSTTNGRATCVTNDGTLELLPSHPAIPASLMPSGGPIENGKGLTYSAVLDSENCYPWGLLLEHFPDVAAVSVCAPPRPTGCAGPMFALSTALFLTQTSTSHEADDGIRTTSPSLGQLGPSVSAVPTDAIQIKSSESSVSFATPRFSSPSEAAVASPPTHSLPLPAPLPTAAPPTPTPLSSSAAGTAFLTQPTQSGTAGLSSVGAGTTTHPIPSPSVFAGPPPIVVGNSTVVANSASQYIILGTTLLPGSTVTIGTGPSATVIALQTSNLETQIIIGTSTSLLAKPSTTEPNIRLPSFTIGTQTITANSLSEYIINGQTLAPGSDLTLGTGPSTTIVALQTSNSQTQLIIGTSTTIIGPPATPPLTSILVPGPITIGTQTLTPDSVSRYLIASQTLVPGGPAITVSGTPVSLAPSATAVVVGTSTSGYKYERVGGLRLEWNRGWILDGDDFRFGGVHRWDGGTAMW